MSIRPIRHSYFGSRFGSQPAANVPAGGGQAAPVPVKTAEQPQSIRNEFFDTVFRSEQTVPTEKPQPVASGKPQKSKGARLIRLYKFTAGILLAGVMPALIFKTPWKKAVAVALTFTTLQTLFIEKVAKGDNAITRKLLEFSQKLMKQDDLDKPGNRERALAPIWGGVYAFLSMMEMGLNALFGHAKQRQIGNLAETLAKNIETSGKKSLAGKANQLLLKGYKTLEAKVLKNPKFTQMSTTKLGKFVKNHYTAMFVAYGVIAAFTAGYVQSLMAAKLEEKLEHSGAK